MRQDCLDGVFGIASSSSLHLDIFMELKGYPSVVANGGAFHGWSALLRMDLHRPISEPRWAFAREYEGLGI